MQVCLLSRKCGRVLVTVAIFLLPLLFFVFSASAAPREITNTSTYVAGSSDLRALVSSQVIQHREALPRLSPVAPIRLSFPVRGLGRVKVLLDTRWNKRWSATRSTVRGHEEENRQLWLLRGKYTIRSRRRNRGQGLRQGRKRIQRGRIAATFYQREGGTYRLLLSFRDRSRRGKPWSYELMVDYPENFSSKESTRARVIRYPDSLDEDIGCEVLPTRLDQQQDEDQVSLRADEYKVVEIFTVADADFTDLLGSEANTIISATVNAASVFYENEVDVQFDVAGQHAFEGTDPYTSNTVAGTLLDDFTFVNHPSGQFGQHDLFHLFTGRNLSGSTVGIAWLGTVCASAHNTGLSQYRSSAASQAALFAHEVGHNFSAGHDDSNDGFGHIMWPSLQSDATTFSEDSKSSINNHVASRNCLGSVPVETPVPTPTPTPTATPNPTPVPTATPSPTPEPTATPGPTATPPVTPPTTPPDSDSTPTVPLPPAPESPDTIDEFQDIVEQAKDLAKTLKKPKLSSGNRTDTLEQLAEFNTILGSLDLNTDLSSVQQKRIARVNRSLTRVLGARRIKGKRFRNKVRKLNKRMRALLRVLS